MYTVLSQELISETISLHQFFLFFSEKRQVNCPGMLTLLCVFERCSSFIYIKTSAKLVQVVTQVVWGQFCFKIYIVFEVFSLDY